MIEPLEELVNLGIDFRVGPRQEPVEIVVYEMVGHGAYLIGPSQGNEFTYWFNSLILASRFKYFGFIGDGTILLQNPPTKKHYKLFSSSDAFSAFIKKEEDYHCKFIGKIPLEEYTSLVLQRGISVVELHPKKVH